MGNEIEILHVVGDSKFGGGALVVLQLAGLAQEMGWKASVLTTDAQFQEAVLRSGASVVDLDVIRKPIVPWFDLAGLLRLWKFLAKSNFTIVHTHTSKAGFVGRIAAKLAGVPVVVHTVHGFAFHEQSSRLALLCYSKLEQLAAHFCDRLVTVSEYHARRALQLHISREDKITAIPNALPVASAHYGSRTRLRDQLGLGEHDLMLLATGRLARQKGFTYLIQAAAILKQKLGRRFMVMIAGDGELASSLREEIEARGVADCVRLLGFRSDVDELLSACDLVVLPSLWEGLSIALLEAMRAAKPIVATSIESNREVATHGEVALLIPPGDPEALSEAILRLIGEPETARRMALTARRVLEDSYSEQRFLDGYRETYLCALTARGVPLPQLDEARAVGPGR